MVSGFIICGTSSFPKEEDDYEIHTRSGGSSSKTKSNKNKNPYSSRGLDKFSSLLAEIEEKRQQIYSQVDDPHDISLVRFVYAGDNDFKPIVVKIKHRIHHLQNQPISDKEKPKTLHSSSSIKVKEGNINKMDFCNKLRICQWKESHFYLLIIAIFILALLVFFGRSFTILCTSIAWFVIPTITKNANSTSSNNKIYATTRLSVKKVITSQGSKSLQTSKQ